MISEILDFNTFYIISYHLQMMENPLSISLAVYGVDQSIDPFIQYKTDIITRNENHTSALK